jgi:hypothetical protein
MISLFGAPHYDEILITMRGLYFDRNLEDLRAEQRGI